MSFVTCSPLRKDSSRCNRWKLQVTVLWISLLLFIFTATPDGVSAKPLFPSSVNTATTAISNINKNKLNAKCTIDGCVGHVAAIRGGGNTGSTDTSRTASPIQIFVNTIKESKRHLIAAGVARAVSIFGMYPVDTIKTRVQMNIPSPFAVAGLYKGVTGSLVGQVPYGVLTFGSYEMYKRTLFNKFANNDKVKPIFLYAAAAIMGDITGSGWLCPSEVIKQQLQGGMYDNTISAIKGIFQKKGIVGFYQGYFGGLSRDVPFRVAQLTSYEVTKNLYLRMKAAKEQANTKSSKKRGNSNTESMQLSAIDSAICGAIAGTFSSAITTPLDRIKTILMTDTANVYGGSVASCISKIWSQEGIKGFTTGIVPRVTYIAPSVALFFIVYEQVQQRLLTLPEDSSKK